MSDSFGMLIGREVTKGLKYAYAQLQKEATQRCFRAANIVRTHAIKGMADSPAGGRTYRVPGTKNAVHVASLPGQYPAILTGQLRASIKVKLVVNLSQGVAISAVGTDVLHGLFLEEGTKFMDPRPWLTLALASAQPQVQRILTEAWFTPIEDPDAEGDAT